MKNGSFSILFKCMRELEMSTHIGMQVIYGGLLLFRQINMIILISINFMIASRLCNKTVMAAKYKPTVIIFVMWCHIT